MEEIESEIKLHVKSHPFYQQGYSEGYKEGYNYVMGEIQPIIHKVTNPPAIMIKPEEAQRLLIDMNATLKQSNEQMQHRIKETTDSLKEIYIRLGTIKFKSPEGDEDFDKLSESIEIVEQLLNKEG